MVDGRVCWREAGPPNHRDDKAESDQEDVNKNISLAGRVCVVDANVGALAIILFTIAN